MVTQENRLYLDRVYFPFEGYRWVAVFVTDPLGSYFGSYKTKKAATEDVKEYGLRIVPKPSTK